MHARFRISVGKVEGCVAAYGAVRFSCAASAAHFLIFDQCKLHLDPSKEEKCGVVKMAVKFTSVKCPECGANLPIEEGREKMFCSYCGTQIIMEGLRLGVTLMLELSEK